MIDPDTLLEKLDQYDLQGFSHTNEGLVSHLKGTFEILKSWGCSETLCVAGLCHSIYGTESYRRNPIDLSERNNIQSIIGGEAEQLAYLFGAHVKDSLWENLSRDEGFRIKDRLAKEDIELSQDDLANLITLTLANWIEQRPRAPEEYLYVRQDEFVNSEKYLPPKGYEDFKKAYGLS